MNTYNANTAPIYKGTQIVWYIFDLIEVLLGLRFILKLLAANPAAGFTDFIYNLSDPLVAPFRAVFRTASVQGNVFEWTTLLAMIIYWLIAWAIIKIFLIGRPISPPEADRKLDKQERE